MTTLSLHFHFLSLLLPGGQVTIYDHCHFAEHAATRFERLQPGINCVDGAFDRFADVRYDEPLYRRLHCQSHAALEESLRLLVEDGGLRKVAQDVDIDMPSSPLCQDGVNRAFGFDQTGRLSGADTK